MMQAFILLLLAFLWLIAEIFSHVSYSIEITVLITGANICGAIAANRRIV